MILVADMPKKIPGQLGLKSEIDKDRSVIIEPVVGGVCLYFNNGARQKSLHLSDDAVGALSACIEAYLEARA